MTLTRPYVPSNDLRLQNQKSQSKKEAKKSMIPKSKIPAAKQQKSGKSGQINCAKACENAQQAQNDLNVTVQTKLASALCLPEGT